MFDLLVFFEESRYSWRPEPGELSRRLLSDWPGVEFVSGPEAGPGHLRDFGWVHREGGGEAEVWAAHGGVGLILAGETGPISRFVVWYRALVPDHVEVHLSDALYSFDVLLDVGTDAQEVARILAEHR